MQTAAAPRKRESSSVLRPIGRFLDWLGSYLPDAPYARILLWTVLIAAALALGWMGEAFVHNQSPSTLGMSKGLARTA